MEDNLQTAYGKMSIAEQVLDMIYNNEKTEIALLFDIKHFMEQVMEDNQKLVDDVLADMADVESRSTGLEEQYEQVKI